MIEGGGTITCDLTLKKGKYVLVCFISDKQGGKTHAAKGMITEAKSSSTRSYWSGRSA